MGRLWRHKALICSPFEKNTTTKTRYGFDSVVTVKDEISMLKGVGMPSHTVAGVAKSRQ